MKLKISSFGRKHGPIAADVIIDVRCLENPFWVPELKELTGLDLPDAEIKKLAELVKAKIDMDKVGDLLGGLGKLFGK